MGTFKTSILLAAVIFLTVSHCKAQKVNDFEFSLGIGIGSSDEMCDGLPLFGPGSKTYNIQQYSGTGSFTFRYFLSKRVTLGVAFAYENESGEWLKNVDYNGGNDDWESIAIGTFIRQTFTVAPEVSVSYFNSGKVRVYCTGGIGATYQNEIDKYSVSYYQGQYNSGVNGLGNPEVANNRVHVNGYLSPVGLSVGGRLRWFTELGIGYKGFVNTGCALNL